jgi:hypothetical protein
LLICPLAGLLVGVCCDEICGFQDIARNGGRWEQGGDALRNGSIDKNIHADAQNHYAERSQSDVALQPPGSRFAQPAGNCVEHL